MWAAALVEQEESSPILCIPRGTVANLNGSSYQCLTLLLPKLLRDNSHTCALGLKWDLAGP